MGEYTLKFMLSKEQLKQVLVEQREAILKKKIGIKRYILKKIESKIKLPHIIVITGIRRCGKSTLLRQIISKYYHDEDFYYINFEDERLFNFKTSDFNIIYETLLELFGDKKTFLIDEIHNISNFETFVRRFYDNGFKFYITGSNARLLSKELGTKLTGRHIDIIVKPFSFSEFLDLKGLKFEREMIYKTEMRAKIKRFFLEYLVKGGMPEYLIYDDAEILMRIYEDIIIKDVAARYSINNITKLRDLYQYLVTNFSSKFSFHSIKKVIDFGSVNTIKKYIAHLEETYFAKLVSKFDYSLKKQLINNKKLFIVDNGFIAEVSTRITKDKGWLLENLVFTFLENYFDVFYYSNKNECDFVVSEQKRLKMAIQVTWELNEKNRKREIEGLVDAMHSLNLKDGMILTYDQEEKIDVKNKKIDVKPVWKFLLEGFK